MHDPDAEDVAGAGRGDRAAAARLIARHAPKLRGLARRMLGTDGEAEDAVQDVFLKLWTHAARWRPGAARFETWLYRVGLNACYDRLRRRGGQPLEDATDVPDFEDRGNLEAAEIMGLSVEAIESLLARGRRNLRARLARFKDVLGD
jgi:RNA polymerase sigma-70 factor (ECF subfamily)